MPQDQLTHHHTSPKMEACTTRRANLKANPHELETQQAVIHHASFCQRSACLARGLRAHQRGLRARHLARARRFTVRHGKRRPRHRRPNSEPRNESLNKLPKLLLVH